jgi:hypothetical protein
MLHAIGEGLILSGSLTLGLFACLDFSPSCCLFHFLSLSWVLSFYGVLQGFIIQKWKISYASNKMEVSATLVSTFNPQCWNFESIDMLHNIKG